ncbi:hypothetical protein CEXT_397701 [Caerostris extrusa]|uniref:Uncharacterized protein n=1 Tax=Caerostris extrusa TaxID=172846 RepID=A0AAV4XTR9_CAEEX|nr:hypothetical protein CEXT_397701 [Caerostris extrusa]
MRHSVGAVIKSSKVKLSPEGCGFSQKEKIETNIENPQRNKHLCSNWARWPKVKVLVAALEKPEEASKVNHCSSSERLKENSLFQRRIYRMR